jgi:apolipoprotein D and lipocalin family protein
MMRATAILLFGLLLGACASAPKAPLPAPNEPVDVERFLGRWYIIANIPYIGERGDVGSFVEYHARGDGRIDDLYFYRKGSLDAPLKQMSGVARIVEGSGNAHWQAQFVWPLWFSFHVLYVDDDYRYTLVGHPDRDLGWIYARDPQVDTQTLDALFDRLIAAGYRREQFVLIPQRSAATSQ